MTNQECAKVVFKDFIKNLLDIILDELPTLMDDIQNNLPGLFDDFWNQHPEVLKKLQVKFPKFTNAIWDMIPQLLEDIRRLHPGDDFKDKLPEILDNDIDQLPNGVTEKMVADNKICITDYGGGMACGGDSGGPLVTKPEDHDGVSPGQNYEQIGVTSYISLFVPCNNSSYTVYARVTKVLDWINNSVGKGHADCHRE